ncbi:alpha/beta hydrolase family protein [Kitasatospora sp. NPDC052868]|uniref:alpha/beta hydrolase family protein n=1 Tax=Kitasatospora sp. NPDC052868 TaxID=3364060 RepID=UPI0037CB8E4E
MRRALLIGAAAVALALAGTATTATAASAGSAVAAQAASRTAQPSSAALQLPEPSGRLPIGRTVLHLTDEGRADPWVPSGDRELMVSLWYPAARPSATPAPYMTPEESAQYVAAIGLPLPPDLMTKVATHATVDAKPLKTWRGLPLVVLSPGFGMPRATLTGLAEELAGRGYAVAGIGHNYEADGISFPDGHTTSCVACENTDYPKVGAVRAADVSFVLDELASGQAVRQSGVQVDTGRVVMVGHSAGGFSTIPAMLGDQRIKAAVNMDGNFRFPNDTPLDRPVLMLGKPSHVPAGPDPTWDETWNELTGWKRWLSVDGTEHLSFTDLAPLAKQLGSPMQPLDGDRVDAITRAYVDAFVDTQLRGTNAPLLNGPSAAYPEVRFHQP